MNEKNGGQNVRGCRGMSKSNKDSIQIAPW